MELFAFAFGVGVVGLVGLGLDPRGLTTAAAGIAKGLCQLPTNHAFATLEEEEGEHAIKTDQKEQKDAPAALQTCCPATPRATAAGT